MEKTPNAYIVTDKRNGNTIAVFSDVDHARDYGKNLIGDHAEVKNIFDEKFIKK
jgi:hypothetical protein